MAVTKTFRAPVSGSIYGSRYMTLKLEEKNVNTENNTSDIDWTLTVSGDSTYYDTGVQISINGTSVYSKAVLWNGGFPAKQGSTSGTLTGIAHNSSDGTKTIDVSFRAYVYEYTYREYGGSMELTTIPRASQIGVTDANIGSTSTITINKMSNSFTTSLFYRIKGTSNWNTIATKTDLQSYAFTVPTSLYSQIPNTRTIECEFKADTYSGDTLVGTSNIVTATFTAVGNPVINSKTAVDTNTTTINLTGTSSKIVKYASIVKATVKATPQNSSTIKKITVNGITATLSTSSGVTTGTVTINSPSSNIFSVEVIDSRDYSVSTTITVASSNFINYIPLTISNYSIVRNMPTDGKVNISLNGNYYNGSFGSASNTLTIQYRYREKNGSWGSWTTISNSNYTYVVTNHQLSNLNYQKQYDFELKVVDKVSTLTITGITVSKGVPIVNWEDGFFNVNGELRRNNQNILLSLYPVGSVYISTNSTSPATLFGGTWTQISNRFLYCTTSGATGTGGASSVSYTPAGTVGGHTLTADEMPKHSHVATTKTTSYGSGSQSSWRCMSFASTNADWNQTVYTGEAGGGGSHSHGFTGTAATISIMPPYMKVYAWYRTA